MRKCIRIPKRLFNATTALLLVAAASNCSAFVLHDSPSGTRGVHRIVVSSLSATPRSRPPKRNNIPKQKQQQQPKLSKGKNRVEELATLAKNLNVQDADEMKQILKQKRLRMADGSDRAKYVDWLLEEDDPKSPSQTTSTTKAPSSKKTNDPSATQPPPPPSNKKTKRNKEQQPSFLTTETFAQCPNIHPSSKRALTEVLQLNQMTEIQSKTLVAASSGTDVLGRARTGTGKTLAFLIPAVERILQTTTTTTAEGIEVLIVSPTRELATQIGEQAAQLTTFHDHIHCQVMFGGTNMKRDVRRLEEQLPTILVATPGRLLDHLQSTTIHNHQKFGKDIMSRQTSLVILDEADRLLDMGFQREIQKILAYLPKQRQTLLFSATIPRELKAIMAQNMKPNYVEVDCINDGDGATHTNARVEQSHVVIPSMDRYLSSVVEIVKMALDRDQNPKMVVFFPTARLVAFYADFFTNRLQIPVMELHSKKSQSYRNRISEEFRDCESGILFTSDVSARGVDYPNVSQVIQFGMASSREQYIHRLGRTGRAGTSGTGWLVLGPFESTVLTELKGLTIPRNEELTELLHRPMEVETQELLNSATHSIREGGNKQQTTAKGAYQAFLGFYLGQLKRMRMKRKDDLVQIANEFSGQMGLPEVPTLTKQMVGKMGLKGVSGIVISEKKVSEDDGRSSGRRNSNSSARKDHLNGKRRPKSGRSSETSGRRR